MSTPDNLLEDDPGVYLDLLTERDEAMQAYERKRAENQRLRAALRDVIFDLHNCEYGGDLPRCEHITDALKIAREALA